MRARHLGALLLGVLILSGLSAIPADAGRSPSGARAAIARGPSVSGALLSLKKSGAITTAAYQQYLTAYTAAKRSLGRLSGTRKVELGAVLTNVQAIAAAGEFIASRLPALFLTLERNRTWWTTDPIPNGDERLSFPPSKLVWEYYPGQGIEIQWLGTFGEANGDYSSGQQNSNLRQLVNEVIPLATKRAGGIAWEYMFRFDGGSPPWTSGLSQGTALQVLSRAWSRFKEPAYLTAAQQALGIFQTPPPAGVQVKTAAGTLYAEYTYAPSDKILNGFVQAVVGLYDYTSITKDPLGLKLFEAGDAEARAEVPHYDTGAWSMYDQFGESNLNYHELLTEFLQHLCERTRKGPPIAPAAPPPPPALPPAPAPGSTGATGSTGSTGTTGTTGTGGTTAARAAAKAPAPVPIAADAIYCTTATRFTADLHTPPAIALLTSSLRGGTHAGVQISLSKISAVSITVRQGSRVIWKNSALLERGKPKLEWTTPNGGGTFSVTVAATDMAGNFATANGTIVVKHH